MPSLNLNQRVNFSPPFNGIQPTQIYAADLPDNLETSPITGDLTRIVNTSAINASLENIINTIMYERPYSNVGVELQLRIFENPSSIESELIRQAVTLGIKQFEPRISVQQIVLNLITDQDAYTLSIYYSLVNNPNQTYQFSVILKRMN